jgi:hypothetical protein
MFINAIVNKKIHRQIHQNVKRRVVNEQTMDHLKGIQTMNQLFDDGIVSNNWMVYGTVKQDDAVGYICTRFVKHGSKEITYVENEIQPRFFSVQDRESNELTCKGENICNASECDEEELREHHVNIEPLNEKEKIICLLGMLNEERYENEPEWIRVGMCLKNVNPSYLDLWINWSKNSPKFKEGVCEKQWRRFKSDHGLRINSLIFWAKTDNPSAYEEYMHEMTATCIEHSINCGAHYDIANIDV